jgi:hypothetical protein
VVVREKEGEGGEVRVGVVAKGIHNEKKKKRKDDNMCLRYILLGLSFLVFSSFCCSMQSRPCSIR